MARRKSEEQSIFTLIVAGVVLAIFACLAFLIPVGWIGTELWRLMARYPAEGFRFTDDELDEVGEAVDEWTEADERLDALHAHAQQEGCHMRMDGRYDERRHLSREINAGVQTAEHDRMVGEYRLDTAFSVPHQRWSSWATPRKWAWAFRLIMVSWVVIYFGFEPGEISLPKDDMESAIAVGMASIPLVLVSLLVGAIGYGIGALTTGSKRPPPGNELCQQQRQERLDALQAQMDAINEDDEDEWTDPLDDELTDPGGITDEDRMAEMWQTMASGSATIMKYIATSNGDLSDMEVDLINRTMRSTFEPHEGAAEAFDRTLLTASVGAEQAQAACEFSIQINQDLGTSIFQLALYLAQLNQGEEAKRRMNQLAQWLDLSRDEVAECYQALLNN